MEFDAKKIVQDICSGGTLVDFNPAQAMIIDGTSIFGDTKSWYLHNKEENMEKKKMTKAEAFEWLKNKKVYVNGNSASIQAKLFEAGFEWSENKRQICHLEQPFLILSEGGGIFYSNDMCHYLERSHEEISVDDILSIEIVEGKPKFGYEKVVELAKPLMEYLNNSGCSERICVTCESIVAEPMATFLHGQMKGC